MFLLGELNNTFYHFTKNIFRKYVVFQLSDSGTFQ